MNIEAVQTVPDTGHAVELTNARQGWCKTRSTKQDRLKKTRVCEVIKNVLLGGILNQCEK